MRQEHLEAFSERSLERGVEIELELCGDHIWLGRIERITPVRGLGAEILRALMEIADDQDMPIRCAVDADSDALIGWYQDLGFEIDLHPGDPGGRKRHYVLDRQPDDALIPYRKQLQKA